MRVDGRTVKRTGLGATRMRSRVLGLCLVVWAPACGLIAGLDGFESATVGAAGSSGMDGEAGSSTSGGGSTTGVVGQGAAGSTSGGRGAAPEDTDASVAGQAQGGNGGDGGNGGNGGDSTGPGTCGNGDVESGEACDDSDTDPDDGCDESCELEDGWTCTGAPSNCLEICGDGLLVGRELDDGRCDDENNRFGDGCDENCIVEANYSCISEPSECSECGDGDPGGTEECDDGNDSNLDACLNSCVTATCGDGYLHSEGDVEECDLGASNGPGSSCALTCVIVNCGDGMVGPGEECDDANLNDNDSCLHNCTWNQCGDGAVYTDITDNANPNAVEECDDANDDNADSCLDSCMYNMCGDGDLLLQLSEPYDDPDGPGVFTASRLGQNDATQVAGGAPQLVAAWTFDLYDIDVEECDDGNAVNTDDCIAEDRDMDGAIECFVPVCGDEIVTPGLGETCDDPVSDDEVCFDEGACSGLVEHAGNGNGICEASEECHCLDCAGATAEVGGDGVCSFGETCECVATCQQSTCGDGHRTSNELCDWGSENGTVGVDCTVRCGPLTCGNASVQSPEECDDGNTVNTDACTNACLFAVCGDGYHSPAGRDGIGGNGDDEECDDGNDVDDDSCSNTCTLN